MLGFLRSMLRDRRRRALVVSTVALYGTLVAMHLAAGLSPWAALYESMRVFTFDVGYTPGDSGWLNAGLWLARLGAPVITLGIAAEVVDHLGLLHLPMLFFQLWGRDHVVVVGAGRLGRHLAEHLHAGGIRVLAVEKDDENDHVADLRRRGIPVLIGDGASRQTLRVAKVDKARALVVATAKDLVNLEVALAARSLGRPDLEVFAHVADDVVRDRLVLNQRVHAYSSFEWIAGDLVKRSHVDHGEGTLYVVAGFGRLGRAVLRRLRAVRAGRILVVDPRLPDLAERDPGVEWLEASMLAPRVFARLALEPRCALRFLVCTDRDEENLRFALEILERLPGRPARVFLRMFRAGHLASALPPELEIVEMVRVIDTRADGADVLEMLRRTSQACDRERGPSGERADGGAA